MRTVIMGNSGSGKSTLARQLCQSGPVCLSLDDIAWNPGVQRKPLDESITALNAFIDKHTSWVIEGCYGDLIEAALPSCERLVFLNPGVDACVAHCLQRPWEPDKYATPEAQQAMLEPLLTWVKTYDTRDDEFGLSSHQRIFNRYQGNKVAYRAACEYA